MLCTCMYELCVLEKSAYAPNKLRRLAHRHCVRDGSVKSTIVNQHNKNHFYVYTTHTAVNQQQQQQQQ